MLRSSLCTLCVLATLSALPAAAAPLDLEAAARQIASSTAEVLQPLKIESVVVAQFSNPFNAHQSSGPGIKAMLIAELKKKGINATSRADVSLMGEFETVIGRTQLANGDERKAPAVTINYKLRQRSSRQVLLDTSEDVNRRQAVITDPADVARIDGSNVNVSASSNAAARDLAASKAVDNPAGNVKIEASAGAVNSIIRVQDSPFAIEILSAQMVGGKAPPMSSFKPVEAFNRKFDDGSESPFVKLNPGDLYIVRVHNNSKHILATGITIDGLSMYHFSTGPKFKYLFVGKEGGIVPGWYKSQKDGYRAFMTRDYQPGSELLKQTDDVGSITVTFAFAWEREADMPADEVGSRGSLETIEGPPIKAPVTIVKRSIGRFRGAVTVRYDKK